MNSINWSILLFFLFFVSPLVSQSTPEQVLISAEQRQQYLEEAQEWRAKGELGQAVKRLNYILAENPNDAPTLLFKGDLLAQQNLFSEAAEIYQQVLHLEYQPVIAQINLSYALFMSGKAKSALLFAEKAWQIDRQNPRALVNYFNALLWNAETQKAAGILEENLSFLPSDQGQVMKARLYTSQGNFRAGLAQYDTLVTLFPEKAYINEYLEVLLAKNETNRAMKLLTKEKDQFPEAERLSLLARIEAKKVQEFGVSYSFFKDIAQNNRKGYHLWWLQGQDKIYQFGIQAGRLDLKTNETNQSSSHYFELKVNENWDNSFSGQTQLGLRQNNFGEQQQFTSFYARQTFQYQPHDRRFFSLFAETNILDYTADLLGKQIRNNSLGFETHLMFTARNGLYTQGSWSKLSDTNERKQIFGSFYHLIQRQSPLKAGINFSALQHKSNQFSGYFSAEKYLNGELFFDYQNQKLWSLPLKLSLQAAAGMQKIESNDWEPALRFEGQLSYHWKSLETTIKYQTSNAASSNGTGYQFDWLTFRLNWSF